MISEEKLDALRMSGMKVRVRRDDEPTNDVKGIVVAWDDTHVLLRKQNRKILKVERSSRFEPLSSPIQTENSTERGTDE